MGTRFDRFRAVAVPRMTATRNPILLRDAFPELLTLLDQMQADHEKELHVDETTNPEQSDTGKWVIVHGIEHMIIGPFLSKEAAEQWAEMSLGSKFLGRWTSRQLIAAGTIYHDEPIGGLG